MNQENTAVSQKEQAISCQPSAVSSVAGKYQPYPEYKDSGEEWLGPLPKGWCVSRIKWLASGAGKSFTDGDWIESPYITDEGVRLLQTGNIGIGAYKEKGFRYVSDETFINLNCTELKPDDVLICRLADPVGRACLAPHLGSRMITSVDVCILKPKEGVDNRFVVYFLSSNEYLGHLNSSSRGGTRQRVSRSDLGDVAFALPGVEEQHTIAAFLDHETARIDALIAKQQRLIALLKEKRQAVISHAVTKGLNPDTPMKDSGIEWLGQVPAHWETSRIGWLCSVGNGMTPNRSNPDYWMGGDQPWLNSSKVNDREVVQADQFVTMKAVAECGLPKVSADSIIMAITGEGKTRGTSAIVRIDTTINQHIAYMTPSNRRLSPEFLLAWLESQYERIRFESEGWGSTKAAITCSDIKRYPLPLPPYAEQSKICDYLVAQHRKFNNLTEKAKTATQLLQERRTALISAAVTGKIDLRGWQLPAGASEVG